MADKKPSAAAQVWRWVKDNRGELLLLILLGAIVYILGWHYSKAHRLFFAIGRRIDPADLGTILGVIMWPCVALVALFALRKVLMGVFERIEELIWGDKRLKWVPPSSPLTGNSKPENCDAPEAAPAPAPAPAPVPAIAAAPIGAPAAPAIHGDKIGNIFWTGADLVSVVNLTLNGGDRDRIAWQLRQANHHMKMTGMKGSPLQIRLQRLTDEAAKSLAKDWTKERRIEVAQESFSIMTAFGQQTEKLQPGFNPYPQD